MKNKIADKLLTIFDEMMPIDWKLPTSIDYINHISIEYGVDGKNFLVLEFTDSLAKNFHQICNGYLAEPTQINETSFFGLTVMRINVHPSVTMAPGAFEFVTYSYTSQVVRDGQIPSGEILASVQTDELKIGFIGAKDYSGNVKYIDPAILIRILAVFNEPYAELLRHALIQDWDSFFELDRFIAEYDNEKKGTARKLLLKEALTREYHTIKKLQTNDDDSDGDGGSGNDDDNDISDIIMIDPDMEKKYTDRIGRKLDTVAQSSDIIHSFATQVNADSENFANYDVEDLGLRLAIFQEDEYDMELIDRREYGNFEDLADENTGCKIIVNGPLFDSGACGLQPIWRRTFEYTVAGLNDVTTLGTYKGLTKGTLYMREKRYPGDCPIPDDPDVWRYYFAQKFNRTYEYKLGRLPAVDEVTYLGPNPDPNEISVAVEPLYGVFREGKRIGKGHEIDTDRNEPDSVFAGKSVEQGIPIIGRCFKDGLSYIFILIREDFYTEPDVAATWEQMIQFMRDLGVVEASITDGDDSVGLIIDDKVIIGPGAKKNTLMPLAIGFIRRNS